MRYGAGATAFQVVSNVCVIISSALLGERPVEAAPAAATPSDTRRQVRA